MGRSETDDDDFFDEDEAPRRRRKSSDGGDSTGGIIPYKNPAALIAYYLGLFSLFPILGAFLGLAAFILGIKGLSDRKKNPKIKGSVHAWIGIVMGGLFGLLWTLLIIGMIFAAMANPR